MTHVATGVMTSVASRAIKSAECSSLVQAKQAAPWSLWSGRTAVEHIFNTQFTPRQHELVQWFFGKKTAVTAEEFSHMVGCMLRWMSILQSGFYTQADGYFLLHRLSSMRDTQALLKIMGALECIKPWLDLVEQCRERIFPSPPILTRSTDQRPVITERSSFFGSRQMTDSRYWNSAEYDRAMEHLEQRILAGHRAAELKMAHCVVEQEVDGSIIRRGSNNSGGGPVAYTILNGMSRENIITAIATSLTCTSTRFTPRQQRQNNWRGTCAWSGNEIDMRTAVIHVLRHRDSWSVLLTSDGGVCRPFQEMDPSPPIVIDHDIDMPKEEDVEEQEEPIVYNDKVEVDDDDDGEVIFLTPGKKSTAAAVTTVPAPADADGWISVARNKRKRGDDEEEEEKMDVVSQSIQEEKIVPVTASTTAASPPPPAKRPKVNPDLHYIVILSDTFGVNHSPMTLAILLHAQTTLHPTHTLPNKLVNAWHSPGEFAIDDILEGICKYTTGNWTSIANFVFAICFDLPAEPESHQHLWNFSQLGIECNERALSIHINRIYAKIRALDKPARAVFANPERNPWFDDESLVPLGGGNKGQLELSHKLADRMIRDATLSVFLRLAFNSKRPIARQIVV